MFYLLATPANNTCASGKAEPITNLLKYCVRELRELDNFSGNTTKKHTVFSELTFSDVWSNIVCPLSHREFAAG